MKSKIWRVDSNEFKRIVNNNYSYADILREMDLPLFGGNYETLKRRIEADKINVEHIKKNFSKFKSERHSRIPLEEILVENSTYSNRTALKNRLINKGLLIEECYECGLEPIWNEKLLKLQLEHKNGVPNDNRIENLILLCPNCHSQTETFSGRNSSQKRIKPQPICIMCNKKISKQSKTHLCKNCFDSNRKNNKLDKHKVLCKNCSNSISLNSKSGLCLSCSNKQRIGTSHKVVHPSKKALQELILTTSFLQIGKMYGVSDNAVRKWCKSYGLPYKRKDIQEIYIKGR